MPVVRLRAGERGSGTVLQATPLSPVFVREAGMDSGDAAAAIRRLGKGKSVDVSFDLGEEKAAKAFMKEAAAFGLTAEFYQDEPLSWSGSRPRPLFLKLSLAVLVGFGICVWLFLSWPQAIVTRVFTIAEVLLLFCWLYSGSGGILDWRPKSQTQKDRENTLGTRYVLGVYVLLALIALIVTAPVIAVILAVLVLCGIGCALLIRLMNRT